MPVCAPHSSSHNCECGSWEQRAALWGASLFCYGQANWGEECAKEMKVEKKVLITRSSHRVASLGSQPATQA